VERAESHAIREIGVPHAPNGERPFVTIPPNAVDLAIR
jgi:hypothetical protein